MGGLLYTTLAAALPLLHFTAAQAAAGGTWPTDIVGTWSTKSNKTLTGPGFYDPINERLIEPSRTGVSYSFTSNGWYEEAHYRAISNPQKPNCPSGIMQWQHGNWYMASNGSLILTPIAVDGRQLLSQPCTYKQSIYTRYNQSELMDRYAVYTDPYHNIPRLDIYRFDGSPMNPMYLAYSPPQMLPTSTLNPVTASSTAGSKSTSTNKAKAKRGEFEVPINWKAKQQDGKEVVHYINADRLWWIGLAMTGLGGLLYLGPRRMGIQL
ncbi:protein rot1-like [Teratosphaeria destructans]|uniref:Protein ROT1 n=1 Tax=Teratosphaeria destructans TaxID=418781 RepID=A0A9W7T0Y9_9PEZI|nr:protein rot1-like [Teratosphaeria destructans]